MTPLLVISCLFAALAVLFLVRAIHSTRRGRLLRAGSSGFSCLVSAVIAATTIVIAVGYYSYGRLIAEQDVAQIEFRVTGPDEYRARLLITGQPDRLFTLRGDEWQIDARLISWQAPFTLLGLEPVYQLERLSGRYTAIDAERSNARTVHALSEASPLDLWLVARRLPVPGIDTYQGSAAYLPMADGARYAISISRNALLARPANEAARLALGHWGDAGIR